MLAVNAVNANSLLKPCAQYVALKTTGTTTGNFGRSSWPDCRKNGVPANLPRRTRVVAGKLGTAMLVAVLSWLISTVISVVAGAILLRHLGYDLIRAIMLNFVAYAIWAVFGVGFGALICSQLGVTGRDRPLSGRRRPPPASSTRSTLTGSTRSGYSRCGSSCPRCPPR
jgi:hypothetical protein